MERSRRGGINMRDIIIRREKQMLQIIEETKRLIQTELAEDRPCEVNIRNYEACIRTLEVSLGWV